MFIFYCVPTIHIIQVIQMILKKDLLNINRERSKITHLRVAQLSQFIRSSFKLEMKLGWQNQKLKAEAEEKKKFEYSTVLQVLKNNELLISPTLRLRYASLWVSGSFEEIHFFHQTDIILSQIAIKLISVNPVLHIFHDFLLAVAYVHAFF